LVALENKADFSPPHQRQLIFRQARDVHTVDHDGPRRRRVQTCQQSEQRALAAARGSHDGHELSGWDFQIDTAQNVDTMAPAIEGLGEISCFENGHSSIMVVGRK